MIQDQETHLPSYVHSLIAQTLGLQVDTPSKLSSWYAIVIHLVTVHVYYHRLRALQNMEVTH